jgi:thioredoxin reductase
MSAETVPTAPAIVIVGAGPAGLTAAAALGAELGDEVLVLEREREAGGIPRHSAHTGYGWRDLRRNVSGPEYARRLTEAATRSGVTLLTGAMVTRVSPGPHLDVTTPSGRMSITPRALVLATGARERPRSARLVAGDRPAGVFTTGQLQNLVHLHHRAPGKRAVVVGAELVSWSAVLTLKEAGCRTVLMTSEHHKPETYAAVSVVGRHLLRVPVATRTQLIRVIGRDRVSAVDVQDVATGMVRRVECDTVVFTGDWIPDNELARAVGVQLDTGSRAPQVDMGMRTSVPGVFAIGNLNHPVDTADVAALDGRHVASGVLDWLREGRAHGDGIAILARPPLRWVAPSRLCADDGAPARHRLLAWSDRFVTAPRIVVRQGDRVIARARVPWPASPGRVFRIPSSVLDRVDRGGDDVEITIE